MSLKAVGPTCSKDLFMSFILARSLSQADLLYCSLLPSSSNLLVLFSFVYFIFFLHFCIFAFNCPRPRTCLPRSSPPCPSWTPWSGPAGSGCSSFPQVLEQRGVAGRGLGRRCRLLDQHIAPESWVQKSAFTIGIRTYICGERDINAIVLSLLWRLHLVSLFCAGVLQYIRFFDIFLSFSSFIFGANEVILLA